MRIVLRGRLLVLASGLPGTFDVEYEMHIVY